MKRSSGKSNLDIVKDYVDGVRPFVQVGYDSNLENSTRKEGEEWEDSQGRKWVWKNSSKRRVSKRATLVLEQRCTCCNMDVRWVVIWMIVFGQKHKCVMIVLPMKKLVSKDLVSGIHLIKSVNLKM